MPFKEISGSRYLLMLMFSKSSSKFAHIIKDAKQFLGKSRELKCEKSDISDKLDVKEYLLTGNALSDRAHGPMGP